MQQYGVTVTEEKDQASMSYQPRGAETAIPRGTSSSADGQGVIDMDVMIVMHCDMDHQHRSEVYKGPLVMQCVKHYVPMDVEYGRIRRHLSEYVTVSD
eukprot:2686368-Amphidinium_carterae.1